MLVPLARAGWPKEILCYHEAETAGGPAHSPGYTNVTEDHGVNMRIEETGGLGNLHSRFFHCAAVS